jgi:hypothetical protein
MELVPELRGDPLLQLDGVVGRCPARHDGYGMRADVLGDLAAESLTCREEPTLLLERHREPVRREHGLDAHLEVLDVHDQEGIERGDLAGVGLWMQVERARFFHANVFLAWRGGWRL